jgi:hypothetical protein
VARTNLGWRIRIMGSSGLRRTLFDTTGEIGRYFRHGRNATPPALDRNQAGAAIAARRELVLSCFEWFHAFGSRRIQMKRIFSSMMLGLVTMTICSWSVDARADATPQGSQVQAVILACRVDTLAITSCSTSPGSGFTCPAVDKRLRHWSRDRLELTGCETHKHTAGWRGDHQLRRHNRIPARVTQAGTI